MSIPIESTLNFQDQSRIENLPAPVADHEPVRKSDLDDAIEGLKTKDNVRVATSSNVNLASPGATLDGETMANDERVLVRGQTASEENGIYIFNGSATPMTRALDADAASELNNAVVRVREGTDAGNTFRQSATVVTLDTDTVTWITFGGSVPSASESTEGTAEIATQPETDTGTDDTRIVTPLKLANWSGRFQGHAESVGDTAATQFDITHNFGTRNVMIVVRETAGTYQQVFVEAKSISDNAVRVNFTSAPATNEFTVMVIKVA